MKQLTIRLTDGDLMLLEKEAESLRISLASLIRMKLVMAMAENHAV